MISRLDFSKSEITQALVSYKKAFITVGAFSAIINILMLVPSVYMLQVYDRVLSSGNKLTLLMLTLMMLGAYLLLSLLEYVRSFVLIRVGAQMDMQLNKRIYTAAFEHNLKKSGGNAGQSLQDLATIRQFLTGNALFAFFDAPWLPIYLVLIFLFEPTLGILAVCSTMLVIVLAYINEKLTHKPLAEATAMAISAGNLATNNLRHAEVIQAMGMLQGLQARWFALHGRFLQLQADASEKAGVINALTKFVNISVQSLVLGYGALLTIDGKISAGMMIAASILVGRAMSPVQLLISVWKQWSTAQNAHARLTELLNENPVRPAAMSLPSPSGAVALEDVSASAPGAEKAIIKRLSFALSAGDVLGVIGPSGSGKSTLARLLVGVWPATGGTV